jgi:hypothetical protein
VQHGGDQQEDRQFLGEQRQTGRQPHRGNVAGRRTTPHGDGEVQGHEAAEQGERLDQVDPAVPEQDRVGRGEQGDQQRERRPAARPGRGHEPPREQREKRNVDARAHSAAVTSRSRTARNA